MKVAIFKVKGSIFKVKVSIFKVARCYFQGTLNESLDSRTGRAPAATEAEAAIGVARHCGHASKNMCGEPSSASHLEANGSQP